MKKRFPQMPRKPLLGGLVALSALMALSSPAAAAIVPRYTGSLQGEPPLARPVSLTLTPDETSICVTDAGAVTLDVFDPRGIHRFRTDGVSMLSSPMDGSLTADGGFVFTGLGSEGERTIRRLNFRGEPEGYEPQAPREGWQPTRLCVGRDGHYVTVDRTGLLAKHHAETGELLWSIQIVEAAADRVDLLGRPSPAPNGNLYVPNPGATGVLVVSGDGEVLTNFGVRGSRHGELLFPVSVAFAAEGRVLVLDRVRHRILVFDSDHEFVTEFGRMGFAPGFFYHPLAITASSDGRVWVAQGYAGWVQEFRLQDSESASGAMSLLAPASTRNEKSGGGR